MTTTRARHAATGLRTAGAIAVAAAASGCLHRTITVTSNPPGAVVWLNDVEIGHTPVETDFTFYGAYDVRMRLDGYEPIVTCQKAKAPIYEYPPFDLIAEILPFPVRTNLEWHYDLEEVAETRLGRDAAYEQLLDRAGELRQNVETGAFDPEHDDQ